MRTSQKLGTMPVGKLLFVMSIPAIFSMLVQAMYNIVDSIYVSRLGENALNAVSLAFPMQMLIMSFALGIGVGTNSLIARKMGEKQVDEANHVAKTGIALSLMGGLLFVLIGLTLTQPFLRMMSSDSEVVFLGSQYLSIVMTLSIIIFLEITITKILQSVGNMIVPMLCQLLGAIVNIILDPIFIFTLGLGVQGAAIATIIAQSMALLLSIASFVFRKQDVSISLKHFRLNKKYVRGILQVGLPVTVMNSIASLTTTTLNGLLITHAPTLAIEKASVNVLGVYYKLQSFVFMPIFGLNQGGMPILGFNFGANNKQRFYHTLKLMIISALAIVSIGFFIFQFYPSTLLNLFNPTELMLDIGVRAFKKISLAFYFAIFGIIFSMTFQAMGHGIKSLFMSLFRQLIILIPVALFLTLTFGIDFIWYGYGIAESITALIFVPIAITTINKEFHKKQDVSHLTEEFA